MTTQTRYTKVAIYLHWLIAALMIYMLFLGEGWIAHSKGTFGPSVHATIGVSILVLSLARFAWRLANPPPALPQGTSKLEAVLSKITHVGFYVLMIGLPLTGLSAFTSHMVEHADSVGSTIFGLFSVPALPDFGAGGAFHAMHNIGSKVGILLLLLHVVGALKHQFWNKDGLLRRMSPH